MKSAIGNSGKFDRNSASLTDPLAPGEVSPRSRGTNTLPDPNRLADTTASTKATAAPPSIDSQRMEMMLKDNPDMPVKMPGSDATVTLREAMAQAADEAAFEKSEASLYQAAVDCALSFGA